MKKFTIIVLVVSMLLMQSFVFAGENDLYANEVEFQVYIDGYLVDNDDYPFLTYKNDVYLPLTYNIVSQLDFKITYSTESFLLDSVSLDFPYKNREIEDATYISRPRFEYRDIPLYINGRLYDTENNPRPFYYKRIMYLPLTDEIIEQLDIEVSWSWETLNIKSNRTANLKEIWDRDEIESLSSQVLKLDVMHFNGEESQGSGFLIEDNLLITNHHVIDGASSIQFVKDDLTYLETDYVIKGFSTLADIAILELTNGLEPLEIATSNALKENDILYTISSPMGQQNIMTSGEVDYVTPHYFQFDAVALPGSSGGAIFNQYGEVVGVIASGDPDNMTINYGVPINMVNQVIPMTGMTLDDFAHINDSARSPNWLTIYEENDKKIITWEDTDADMYKLYVNYLDPINGNIIYQKTFDTEDTQIEYDSNINEFFSFSVVAQKDNVWTELEYAFMFGLDKMYLVPFAKEVYDFKHHLITDQGTIEIKDIEIIKRDSFLYVELHLDEENFFSAVDAVEHSYEQLIGEMNVILNMVADYYDYYSTTIDLVFDQYGEDMNPEVVEFASQVSTVHSQATIGDRYYNQEVQTSVHMILVYGSRVGDNFYYHSWKESLEQ